MIFFYEFFPLPPNYALPLPFQAGVTYRPSASIIA